jgi:hypothetical protein
MCNLYSMTKTNAEVAYLFGAQVSEVGNAGGGEVYPGTPGGRCKWIVALDGLGLSPRA